MRNSVEDVERDEGYEQERHANLSEN